MNKYIKYALLTAIVALVSGLVSWGVVRVTLSNASPTNSSSYSALPRPNNSSMTESYGFLQSDYELTSSRTVGNAPDLTPAAELAVQAVVHIKVEGEQTIDYIDPLDFFFGGGRGFDRPQSRTVTSFGSGVIISTDGYIITNNHVVEGAKSVTVSLDDNRTFEAKLIGSDPTVDIALLKVDAKDLPTIPFGDSDKIKLGEWVLAVGNPFNLTGTVTAGIIGAKARSTAIEGPQGSAQIARYIQTDAAVNRGNSGGALVDAEGHLIGINTMLLSETGNYSGYSFAVPINTAAKIVSDIKKYGSVQRAVLGIIGGSVNEEIKKEKGLKVSQGVYVSEFTEVSAAYAAGIEEGDVIVAIDGSKISEMGELQERIGRCRPGDSILVTVDRKGSKRDFKVQLKNAEGTTKIVKKDNNSLLGATLKEISRDQMRQHGISYGLEVVKVGRGKLQTAGIKEGFIILSINNSPVRTIAAAQKIITAIQKTRRGDKYILIKGFYRGGSMRYYTIDLD